MKGTQTMFKLVAHHEGISVYQKFQDGKTITHIESEYKYHHVVDTWHNLTPIRPPQYHSEQERKFVKNFFALFTS
jgi:hypothetical protein